MQMYVKRQIELGFQFNSIVVVGLSNERILQTFEAYFDCFNENPCHKTGHIFK